MLLHASMGLARPTAAVMGVEMTGPVMQTSSANKNKTQNEEQQLNKRAAYSNNRETQAVKYSFVAKGSVLACRTER
jgi:hypothetical protein